MKSTIHTKALSLFSDLRNKVSIHDLAMIRRNIKGMNRGALKSNWYKVLMLLSVAKDIRSPWARRAIAISALLYAVMPVDAIPDIVPVLGLVDDAAVVMAALVSLGARYKQYAEENTPPDTGMAVEKN